MPCDFRYATLNFKIPAPPRSTFRANPALFDYQSGSPSHHYRQTINTGGTNPVLRTPI
jgi:hypothetical protein